jgi:hypothetical protein
MGRFGGPALPQSEIRAFVACCLRRRCHEIVALHEQTDAASFAPERLFKAEEPLNRRGAIKEGNPVEPPECRQAMCVHSIRLSLPDRLPCETAAGDKIGEFDLGDAPKVLIFPPQPTRRVENTGSRPIRGFRVEFKNGQLKSGDRPEMIWGMLSP